MRFLSRFESWNLPSTHGIFHHTSLLHLKTPTLTGVWNKTGVTIFILNVLVMKCQPRSNCSWMTDLVRVYTSYHSNAIFSLVRLIKGSVQILRWVWWGRWAELMFRIDIWVFWQKKIIWPENATITDNRSTNGTQRKRYIK